MIYYCCNIFINTYFCDVKITDDVCKKLAKCFINRGEIIIDAICSVY